MDLDKRTIKELQALAKKRGLSGYSKLSKPELLRQLKAADKKTAARQKKPGAAKRTSPKAQGPAKAKAKPKIKAKAQPKPKAKAAKPAQPAPPAPRPAPTPPPLSQAGAPESPERHSLDSGEVQVEEAKYALSPRGTEVPPHLVPDLSEDIDRLPAIARSHLRLLPQKPGILHTYWVLPREMLDRRPPLMLRLCRIREHGVEVVEEFRVESERGYWYFHLPTGAPEMEFCVQVGQYRDSTFFTALPRGTARMPTLYASRRTAEAWWVSPEQFRALYLRAGGREEGGALAWFASQSSR